MRFLSYALAIAFLVIAANSNAAEARLVSDDFSVTSEAIVVPSATDFDLFLGEEMARADYSQYLDRIMVILLPDPFQENHTDFHVEVLPSDDEHQTTITF